VQARGGASHRPVMVRTLQGIMQMDRPTYGAHLSQYTVLNDYIMQIQSAKMARDRPSDKWGRIHEGIDACNFCLF
jgi:hypothetical protein